MNEKTAEQQPNRSKKPRPRSPAYPAINLAQAVERVGQLYTEERTHPAPLAAAFRHWGYESTAGDGNLVASALKKFGLVDYEGAGTSRRLKVTPLAVKILEHPNESERAAALKAAALLPAIHKELWAKHQAEGLPSDASLRWELEQERGFTPTGAAEFIPEYKATLSHAGLVAGDTVEPQGNGEDESDDEEESPLPPRRRPRPRRMSDPNANVLTIPLMGGRSVVVEGEFPIAEQDWAQFMAVLEAMKPGLVGERTEPTAEEEDPYSG